MRKQVVELANLALRFFVRQRSRLLKRSVYESVLGIGDYGFRLLRILLFQRLDSLFCLCDYLVVVVILAEESACLVVLLQELDGQEARRQTVADGWVFPYHTLYALYGILDFRAVVYVNVAH